MHNVSSINFVITNCYIIVCFLLIVYLYVVVMYSYMSLHMWYIMCEERSFCNQ
jgi:hypothetical protein